MKDSLRIYRSIPDLLGKNGWRQSVYVRDTELVGVGGYGERPFGFCVDLGTTKIAAELVDLESSRCSGDRHASARDKSSRIRIIGS